MTNYKRFCVREVLIETNMVRTMKRSKFWGSASSVRFGKGFIESMVALYIKTLIKESSIPSYGLPLSLFLSSNSYITHYIMKRLMDLQYSPKISYSNS